uniref:inositol-polyphosphate 5-phosphatase n=1 Tax=Phallusia mammillata TaxID=59560 RepID=A0A6F9DEI0_9ASCI|nr:type I inositol 1,4,5-trisphosphate 5-phosphatase-like [Phallusia mammillata]
MTSFLLGVISKLRGLILRDDTMTGSRSNDAVENMNYLIITANVGTLFEDPEGIQNVWMEEVFKVVKERQPHLIAMHCQEIGGKDYKSSMEPVKEFFDKLMSSEALNEFVIVRGYLDGDFDHVDQYTALGNIYFVHKSVNNAMLFNYTSGEFEDVSEKKVFSKDIPKLSCVKKEKFEQNFFPDCRWSRKGYCRVRWRINGQVIEFVNIHLFHDDNNLVSIKSSPSPYTSYRKRALKFVLNRLQEESPCRDGVSFVCGDFNFRLDVKSLVQKLCPASKQQVVRAPTEEEEVIRVVYRNGESESTDDEASVTNGNEESTSDEVLVKIEKKVFEVEQSLLRPNSSYSHLRRFDLEPNDVEGKLMEFDVSFPPTYPFSEDTSNGEGYMDTRCPSWCDRILLTQDSWDWIHSQENHGNAVYDTIGSNVCMGDHKPVYLAFTAAAQKPDEPVPEDKAQSSTTDEATT